MDHNHFEHCLRGWPTLLALLAVASLGTAAFIALLGGAGWLLTIRRQSVTTPARPVLAMPARVVEVATGPVATVAEQAGTAWRQPAERAHQPTGSGPVPAAWWVGPVRPVRDPKPAEGAWPRARRRRSHRLCPGTRENAVALYLVGRRVRAKVRVRVLPHDVALGRPFEEAAGETRD
jgi:hypothetical protein